MRKRSEQVEQLYQVLEQVGAKNLRLFAQEGSPAKDILLALAAALEATDAKGAVEKVFREQEASISQLGESFLSGTALQELQRHAQKEGARLQSQLKTLQRQEERIRAEKEDVRWLLSELDDLDPGLRSTLERALELMGKSNLSSIGAVLSSVETVAQELQKSPKDLQLQDIPLEKLQKQAEQLKDGIGLDELSSLVEELESLRAKLPNPKMTAKLALAAAYRTMKAKGPAHTQTMEAWNKAFALSITAEDWVLAKTAGRRVQVQELSRQNPEGAIVVVHRLAELAESLQLTVLAVSYRLEEASALLRLPTYRQDAIFLAEQVLTRLQKEKDIESFLHARALLVVSQARESVGELEEAKRGYQRVMRIFKRDPLATREVAWAAFQLGAIQYREKRVRRGLANLALARLFGKKLRDWILYTTALQACLNIACQDRAKSVVLSLLKEGEEQAPRLVNEDVAKQAIAYWWDTAIAAFGTEIRDRAAGS